MGLRPTAYWLATIIMDMIFGIVMVGLIATVTIVTGNTFLMEDPLAFVATMLFFIFDLVTFGYMFGFLVPNALEGAKRYPAFIALSYFIPSLVAAPFPNDSKYIKYVNMASLVFGPSVRMNFGLTSLIPHEYFPNDTHVLANLPFELPYIYVGLMIFFGLLALKFAIKKDSSIYSLSDAKKTTSVTTGNEDILIENEDVDKEIERINAPDNKDNVKAIGLKKVYSNGFQALSNVNFGVEKG
eukprot:CAMPEP_0114575210 /NCGR_PEP_ID=MMETSP0125-20121206/115_1 /TAXON_ID=485358 ORGANISM="Aristerostoma sp., Strain ATCC 50986" /NCGR_SAMPLE_ID=MMETSP0125 /ASSEMBLY_ACC=CAM_ASM_000245 /LENGTH=240 /DNA_ID=CAMNT_0001762783 /DNA_START=1753 /DNA_END=2475 /DNA_ORIENTATION=-